MTSYPRVFGCCFDQRLHHNSICGKSPAIPNRNVLSKLGLPKFILLGLKPPDLPKLFLEKSPSWPSESPQPSTSTSAQWCRPKFLAIHNSNLPGHAGWIPAQLKRKAAAAQDPDHAWYELMNGSLGLGRLGWLGWGSLQVG